MIGISHLLWIFPAALVGFLVSLVFGNLKSLPVDLYYLIYFVIVGVFFTLYVRNTSFDYRTWSSTNLIIGFILGIVVAFVMARNVFSRPETSKLVGNMLAWALLWRGAVYGFVDGLLLSSFPWIVTWRAFGVGDRPVLEKVAFSLLAWLFVLVVTTAYHAGYKDFRSRKLIQPNIGNTLISFPTFISGNPIAAPIAHAGMHIAAVIHSPDTDLYLPPHRGE